MQRPIHPDEQALSQSLRDGDYPAFEAIYDLYKRPLAARLLKLLKSKEQVAETMQELFLRLWENRSSIDPQRPIKGYLFRIAENMVYDFFRKAANDSKMKTQLLRRAGSAYDSIEKLLYEKESRDLLYRIIDQLPPQRKKVFMLCKLEEKSYREISESLGISIAAVNDHITKANAFLKRYLAAYPNLAVPLILGFMLQAI
ncbi:RNA polymerase sigma factor [Chitinophaga filiformis]|uniref:RNA polymerase sigma-70 factor, ECF subfamily n=1 Tax=Chitinophaga filiformis TaxID=104663 RepID=A0A1G7MJ64_CHIFI|nr:RNA polymerase sigma-70 factor [Chitinophaga filiformis]SDF61737.1 RNA polymerase sigma-70 factor, ECF subfamily [Chitinophaga filiformis]